MKIAIIGSGISGLLCAHLLNAKHDVFIYEKSNRIGGHSHTKNFILNDFDYAIDTGFIVFNEWTYPNFLKLLNHLNVEKQKSDMSFSVTNQAINLCYNGTSLNSLFAQRRNLANIKFIKMLNEILRFNRESIEMLKNQNLTLSLGEYLEENNYSRYFKQNYILPMGAAIWSCGLADINNFPAHYFISFFKNHGMLSINQRPQWYAVKGGSQSYLTPLVESFKHKIHLNTPVQSIYRHEQSVSIRTNIHTEEFDHVIIATHSDQAMALLADPTPEEIDILSAIPYQKSEVTLHHDESLLPPALIARASWNYQILNNDKNPHITYYMNKLQNIKSPHHFCVSLNMREKIDPSKIISNLEYSHPTYSARSYAAQKKYSQISGNHRTHYCGAYWGNGFHEDAVNSALKATSFFGIDHL